MSPAFPYCPPQRRSLPPAVVRVTLARQTEALQVADDLGLTFNRALRLVLDMDRCSVVEA